MDMAHHVVNCIPPPCEGRPNAREHMAAGTAIMGGEIDGWLRDDNNGISLYFAISGMDLLVLGFLAEDPSHPRHAEKDRSRSRASATHGTACSARPVGNQSAFT